LVALYNIQHGNVLGLFYNSYKAYLLICGTSSAVINKLQRV